MTQCKQELSAAVSASMLKGKEAATAYARAQSSEEVDPRISYPCYKSLDEFIDVERLKSLDGYLTERILRHIRAQNDLRFYTGPYRLNDNAPDRPGSRMIYLAQS